MSENMVMGIIKDAIQTGLLTGSWMLHQLLAFTERIFAMITQVIK